MATTLASDADILKRIEEFRERHKMPASTFGRLALRDPNLIPNLEAGRSLTLKSAQRIVDFMSEYPDEEKPGIAA